MMVTFRWIEMFLFFILMLQFGGVNSGDLPLSFTVRDGDKVTLPCETLINNHHNCDTTVWLFTDSRGTPAVELVYLGQIKEQKSDRLSVTAECSLVIKKVTAEDVGRYTCRQFRGNPGRPQGPDAVVYLSVVSSEKSNTATTIKSETTTGNTTKELEIMDDSTKLQGSCWYRLIIVPLGLAALIAAVVVINIWTRTGENVHT
uniref:uncharacterized protein LOC112432851 n=1 Tax=Maylandia zebra TaxID=106582 RepID=UPI000D315839|nr:uncharacterized protein LOC112432851 [Maylandia zebra]